MMKEGKCENEQERNAKKEQKRVNIEKELWCAKTKMGRKGTKKNEEKNKRNI